MADLGSNCPDFEMGSQIFGDLSGCTKWVEESPNFSTVGVKWFYFVYLRAVELYSEQKMGCNVWSIWIVHIYLQT